MLSASLYDLEGKKVGKVELDKTIFGSKVNDVLLRQTMRMYANNKRSGCASTKTRKEVRGGGKRPWRQKGTGRARASSIRSPIWRGGGVVFGPHPRSYPYKLPKKVKALAVISALKVKLDNKQLVLMKEIKIDEPKTKKVVSMLSKLKALDRPLIITAALDSNLKRASRNIPGLSVKTPADCNAYDIIRHHKLIIAEDALNKLTSRLLQ